MQEDVGDTSSIPNWEDPLEKEMATHSSILAWRIPWTEEPGGLQSMDSQRVYTHTLLITVITLYVSSPPTDPSPISSKLHTCSPLPSIIPSAFLTLALKPFPPFLIKLLDQVIAFFSLSSFQDKGYLLTHISLELKYSFFHCYLCTPLLLSFMTSVWCVS